MQTSDSLTGLSALGEKAAADRVELTVPETGVCGRAGLFDDQAAAEPDAVGCCATPEPALVQLGAGALAADAAVDEAPAGGCCGA